MYINIHINKIYSSFLGCELYMTYQRLSDGPDTPGQNDC